MQHSFLLSFNFQCRMDDILLDLVSQHESPTYNCSNGIWSYKLDGDCPYVGQQLLQKVSESKQLQILKLLLMEMMMMLLMRFNTIV